MRVLAAFDSFKGTASAQSVGQRLIDQYGAHQIVACPLSDGGEGFGPVLAERWDVVPTFDARGRTRFGRIGFRGDEVIVEAADAVGLVQVGGAERNDPIRADSLGVALLLRAALAHQPRTILIGCGGSAISDGGIGCLRLARRLGLQLGFTQLVVAADVQTVFTQAATVFGPQKGAGPAEIVLLTRRLVALQDWYHSVYGVDLGGLAGGGAAGGLAGALFAFGASITSGFDIVAAHVGLANLIAQTDLVVTGEGRLDATSFDGKVVGGVLRLAEHQGARVLVIAGSADKAAEAQIVRRGHRLVVLSEMFGEAASFADPKELIVRVIASELR